MVNKSGNRILWLDSLKLFAIFLVVWGHVFLDMGYVDALKYTGLNGLIYSFHMPLFMTLSGYVSFKVISRQGNIKRKFVQLIIPCLSLAIICHFLHYDNNFWYLKCLFYCYVIADLYYRITFPGKAVLFCILCFFLFPITARYQYSYKIDFMLPFFFGGLFLREKQYIITKNLPTLLLVSGSCFLVCSIFWQKQYIYYFSKPNYIDYRFLIKAHKFLFDEMNLVMVGFRYIAGFCGTCFFIFLFEYIYSLKTRFCSLLSQLAQYGKYSLHIYILQSFFVSWGIMPFRFSIENRNLYDYLYTPCYSLFILVLCICLANLLERNRYINLLLFGKYWK